MNTAIRSRHTPRAVRKLLALAEKSFVGCVKRTATVGIGALHAPYAHGVCLLRLAAIFFLGVLFVVKATAADAPASDQVPEIEAAKKLMADVDNAFDARDRERLVRDAREQLAKFLREKPNDPAAPRAAALWGDSLLKQAVDAIRLAKAAGDKDQQELGLVDARTPLKEAREKFEMARRKFKEQLDAISPTSKESDNEANAGNESSETEKPAKPGKTVKPKTPKTKKPVKTSKAKAAEEAERQEAIAVRAEAEWNVEEAQFRIALIDYWLAQTYADPKSEERTEMLKKASAEFDEVYQENRVGTGGLTVVGLKAHAWQGKTVEELGDLTTAVDIYDEVLAGAPDPGEKTPSTGLEPLFSEVEHFRLQILAKQNPEQFLADAASWLQRYRRLNKTENYQAVALEAAKAMLAAAENATGSEKTKRLSEALQTLAAMGKVRGPYQREAILLRRNALAAAGKSDLKITTFDEAMALGGAAAESKQWEQAQDAYEKAIVFAEKAKVVDAAAVASAREAIAGVQCMIARDLLANGKYEECIAMARGIVMDAETKEVRHESAAAALASALAVEAALNAYNEAPADRKPAALEKLSKLAEFTEKNWPDRAEADDARIARGRAKWLTGEVRDAIDVFERVNPKSLRYPLAMWTAGQCYWNLYVVERLKKADERDAKSMAANRAKAVECLIAAIAARRAASPSSIYPEAQLLLAEIRMEGGDAEGAAALYQPLVDLLKAEKPKSLDRDMLRVFLGAVRAYCMAGDVDRAGQVGLLLVELGPDTPQVDAALVDFARLLNEERKKTQALIGDLETTLKNAELAKAKKRLASLQTLLGDILVKLTARKNVSLAGMVFIGNALSAVGKTSEAAGEYQKILDRAESDPAFAKTAEKAITRVRAELVGVLRTEGKFADALKQAEQLIHDNPRALEPLLEKGKILQDWAEKEPAKFDEAVSHWTSVRNRLGGVGRKPPEYYDVVYNVAACLVRQAELSKDKAVVMDRAKKAEQVLKSALILSPKLSGPDTIVRYRTLLDKAIALQGREPERRKP